MAAYFARQLGHPAGRPAALAMMYMQLQRQAMLWGFVDIFRWTALVSFTAGGMAWLFRRVTHEPGGGVKVH